MEVCEICGATSFSIHGRRRTDDRFLQCRQCLTVFNQAFEQVADRKMSIDRAELDRTFQGYDNRYRKGEMGRILREGIEWKGSSLDIGCFEGRLVEFCRSKGMEAFGLEIQPEMVSFCREQGLDVFQGAFPTDLPGELAERSFSLITAFETIYYWEDLHASARRLASLLEPGGRLLLKVSQGTSLFFRRHAIDSRTRDFRAMLNQRALDILMASHGLVPEWYEAHTVIWDPKIHAAASARWKAFYVRRRRLRTAWVRRFRSPLAWDKILLLYRKPA